jgi:hypothetical protein
MPLVSSVSLPLCNVNDVDDKYYDYLDRLNIIGSIMLEIPSSSSSLIDDNIVSIIMKLIDEKGYKCNLRGFNIDNDDIVVKFLGNSTFYHSIVTIIIT